MELGEIANELISNWTMILAKGPEGTDPQEVTDVNFQCDSFCENNKHFVLQSFPDDKFLCKCYQNPLKVFDCDEEEGVKLVQIHCRDLVVPTLAYPRNTMAKIRSGFKPRQGHALTDSQSEPLASGASNPEWRSHENLHHHHPEDESVTKESKDEALGLAAIVLGMVSLVCLTVLGVKTWCDHQSNLRKSQSQDALDDSVTSKSDPPKLKALTAGPLVYEKH